MFLYVSSRFLDRVVKGFGVVPGPIAILHYSQCRAELKSAVGWSLFFFAGTHAEGKKGETGPPGTDNATLGWLKLT